METVKTPEQVAQELEAARKVAEEKEMRYAEAQKKLTDLATENATLRKREQDLSNDNEVKKQQNDLAGLNVEVREIVAKMSENPEEATAKLTALLAKNKSAAAQETINSLLPKLELYVNKRDYMSKMRTDHPEYSKHENLMKPVIEAKIKEKKMTLEQAVEETMNEFKPLVEQGKANNAAPAGSGGYQGANPNPPKKDSNVEPEVISRDFSEHSRIETQSEIEERKQWQRGKHITRKP